VQPNDDPGRSALLRDLEALNRNLEALDAAPLFSLEAAGALDLDDLRYVVKVTGRHLARVGDALEGF
jgi:hypothetical protein